MHVVNSVRTCGYYGMDIAAMVREGLVDVLIPARGHFFPDELGERHVTIEALAEFVALAKETGVRIRPASEDSYWADGGAAQRASAYYRPSAKWTYQCASALRPYRGA